MKRIIIYIGVIILFSCKESNKSKNNTEWKVIYNENTSEYDVFHNGESYGKLEFDKSQYLIYRPNYSQKRIFLDSVGICAIGNYKNGLSNGSAFFFDANSVLRNISWFHNGRNFFDLKNIKATEAYIPEGKAENIDTNIITLPNIFLWENDKDSSLYRLSIYSTSYPINFMSITSRLDLISSEYDYIANSYSFDFKKSNINEDGDTLRLSFAYKDVQTGQIIKTLNFEKGLADLLIESGQN